MQDLVEVPVDEVDLGAVHGQPGPAIHDAAPLTRSKDLTRPAERDDVGRVEPVPVVKTEVPVRTIDSRIRRPRPSESDSDNPGDRGQLRSEVLHGTSILQPLPRPFLNR